MGNWGHFDSDNDADDFLASICAEIHRKDEEKERPEPKPWLRTAYQGLDLTAHINNHPYALMNIPDEVAARSDYELNNFTAGPVRPPFGYEVGRGRYSINWMIQKYARKISFQFVNWRDSVEVTGYLGQYIEMLKSELNVLEQEANTKDTKELVNSANDYLVMAENFYICIKRISEKLQHFYSDEDMFTAKKNGRKAKPNVFRLDTLDVGVVDYSQDYRQKKVTSDDQVKVASTNLEMFNRTRKQK